MSSPLNTSGRIVDGRAFTGQIFNPYRVRVYLGSAEVFPASSNTQVKFDTLSFDTAMAFSTTAWNFTVPVAGYYDLATSIGLTLPAVANANQLWQPQFFVNGSVASKGQVGVFLQGGIGAAQPVTGIGTDQLYLNTGDVVDVRITCGALGGNANAITGSAETYFSVKLSN